MHTAALPSTSTTFSIGQVFDSCAKDPEASPTTPSEIPNAIRAIPRFKELFLILSSICRPRLSDLLPGSCLSSTKRRTSSIHIPSFPNSTHLIVQSPELNNLNHQTFPRF